MFHKHATAVGWKRSVIHTVSENTEVMVRPLDFSLDWIELESASPEAVLAGRRLL